MKRLVPAVLRLAVLAGAGFWVLTAPALCAALRGGRARSRPGAADLANGRELFFAGGCASCHAIAGAGRPHAARRRAGAALAIRDFYVPNISPAPAGRHRRLDRGAVHPGHAGGRLAGRTALLPGVSLHLLPAHDGGRPRRPFRASSRRFRRSKGGRAITTCRSRSTSAAASGSGSSPSWTAGRSTPDPAKSAEWNRGRYLVEGPATAPNATRRATFAGAIIADRVSRGGPDPEGKGTVPNITPDKTGIGAGRRATSPSC